MYAKSDLTLSPILGQLRRNERAFQSVRADAIFADGATPFVDAPTALGKRFGASHTYITGTKTSVSTSELKPPPQTTTPKLLRTLDPGTSASASGMFAATIEMLVIMIGRKRMRALSRIAAILFMPRSRNVLA